MKSTLACLGCIAMLAVACGDDDGPGGGGQGGGQGGGADGGGGEGGGGVGGSDTCTMEQACQDGGICSWGDDGGCEPGAVGMCTPTNGFCDGPPTGPICDCTGTIREGDFPSCSDNGVARQPPEACASGTFPCGDIECARELEVCVTTIPGRKGADTLYECRALAEGLEGSCIGGIADCGCMDLTPLGCANDGGCSCTADGDHQETVTIALP